MTEIVQRYQVTNSLVFMASKTMADYLVDYCVEVIENYAGSNQHLNELFSVRERSGKVLDQEPVSEADFHQLLSSLYNIKSYYWEKSALGDEANTFYRKFVNRSLMQRLKEDILLNRYPLITLIVYLLFCYDAPHLEEVVLNIASDSDCQLLGKLLKNLSPFHIRSIDSRWFTFSLTSPLTVIFRYSYYLDKIVICGTTLSFNDLRLIMKLKNLKEIGLEEIKMDCYRFFFRNLSCRDVVLRLATGMDCEVTFSKLERIYITDVAGIVPLGDLHYLSYCLLYKYEKLITNLFKPDYNYERMCKVGYIYFAKAKDEVLDEISRNGVNYNCDTFPYKISKTTGYRFIYHSITEEPICYKEWFEGSLKTNVAYERFTVRNSLLVESKAYPNLQRLWVKSQFLRFIQFDIKFKFTTVGLMSIFHCLRNCRRLECLEINYMLTALSIRDRIPMELFPLPSIKSLIFTGNCELASTMNLIGKLILVAPNMKILSLSNSTVRVLRFMTGKQFQNLQILHLKDAQHFLRKPLAVRSCIEDMPSIKEVILENVGYSFEKTLANVRLTASPTILFIPGCSFFREIHSIMWGYSQRHRVKKRRRVE